ncbi:response regulator [Marinoscillum furvescens]|nr:response regulator [Marinoscillum furvescens]
MNIRYFITCICVLIGLFATAQTAEQGVLDLRNVDFSEESVPLDGEWQFFWGQLLEPGDEVSTPIDYFEFPELWNDATTRQGVKLENFGVASYRLQVLLPESSPELALTFKHLYSAGRLFVNGKEVPFCGQTGNTPSTSKPRWVPGVIELHDEVDTLNLLLQISNFQHYKGGARESIVLGAEERIDALEKETLAYDLLLAGTLIMAGLFFYGLYLFGLREKAAIFFSLFCLTFAYRMVGADDYSLQIIYPNMPWGLSMKLEYLSLFLPPAFFAMYTHYLYPFRYRFNPFYIFASLSCVFALITVVSHPLVFTRIVDAYLFLLLAGISLGGYTYFRAYQLKLGGSQYALISSLVVLVVFCYKIIIYLGAATEIEIITFIGFLGFFFFQSLILFFLFTDSLKRSKEQAEHAAKMKSDFLSMMSHEIRTPMNAVIGLSNYLLEDSPRKSQVETLNTLKFSAKNLLVIINDILDFSKIEAEKIEFEYTPVLLQGLMASLKKVFEPIAEEKNLKLVFDCDNRIPQVIRCDQTRTSQVLTNLISNAIKFTEKGVVKVKVELVAGGLHQVRLKFSVIDTGIGIPQDRQESIFQSFTQATSSTTRQFGGTGLGLTITKKLLNLQGVELKLDSEPGKGSVFSFIQAFEVVRDSMPAYSDAPQTINSYQLPVEVLLVEDNAVNIMVAEKFLKRWGAKVVVAKNGQEAIDAVGNSAFDVILMDLQMPIMDGYEAVRKIRQRGVSIPIIALTASALMEEQRKIFDAGMDAFVTKPFEPEELYQKMAQFCR